VSDTQPSEDVQPLGTLIGNTGQLTVTAALSDSYSAKRGGFIRIRHQEERDEPEQWVLGRVVQLSRENMLFDEDMGSEVSDIRLLEDQAVTEDVFASIELIGYVKPSTGEIKTPRRPLDPGANIYPVTGKFLKSFYEYTPDSSIRIGNLIGYEEGPNQVPVYLDIDKITTEHLAVLAMTGAGKSYTIGRLMELMVTRMNASVLVFDPHGEYGAALKDGTLNFNEELDGLSDEATDELAETRSRLKELQQQGGGVKVYAPQSRIASEKYGPDNYTPLRLRLDSLGKDELRNIMPNMSEPQERLLSVVLRYWESRFDSPRTISDLRSLLTDNLDEVKNWSQITEEEQSALSSRSASIISLRLRNLIEDAGVFYNGSGKPIDLRDVVGRQNSVSEADNAGRVSIVDLQNISKQAMQVVVAILGNELLEAIVDTSNPIRPVFTVLEEGHTFAPATGGSVAKPVIKKIAAEGRKFGIGMGIVSQRPSKLDSDVTSQCNTILTMRIKNPEDQSFIRQTSEMLSEQDINELPALSTGEALVTGRATRAPLLVKVGRKTLVHGGMSPEVVNIWQDTN
jgi:DNA helicase HerA-like ATPase